MAKVHNWSAIAICLMKDKVPKEFEDVIVAGLGPATVHAKLGPFVDEAQLEQQPEGAACFVLVRERFVYLVHGNLGGRQLVKGTLSDHTRHVKDGRRIVGHIPWTDQVHDQRKQRSTVLTSNVLFALGHGLVVGDISGQYLRTSRQRHDDTAQGKHILPLKIRQRLACLKLQSIWNANAVDTDSNPSTDGTAGRTDGTDPSLGGTKDVVHLQRSDGQVGPMDGLDDAHQLRHYAP